MAEVRRYFTFTVLVFAAAGLFMRAGAQPTIIQNVQRSFQSMQDAVITYRQIVQFPLTRQEQSFKGVVYMKKPLSYRIESEQQTVITDGTTIWSYNPFTEQVIVDTYREEEQSFTPDRFLLNIPDDYYVTIGERETVDERSLVTARLIPKDDNQFIRSMRLWIDEGRWIIRRAEVTDLNDNLTTYIVEEISIDKGIAESLFTFQPASHVEVIDLR